MRLIASLAAAAAVLADQAADRLDAWVENTTRADDEPNDGPIGFAVPTGVTVKGVDAKGLTGEQRARWLAEVKTRVDASTGGPWVTDLNAIVSPYGVIATGVTSEADRDLIEDARADLFGLLALAQYDDVVIANAEAEVASQDGRRAEAERELAGMHEREAAVERVLASLVDGRLKLTEYIDPETPASRVAELVTTLLTQIRDAENGAEVQHLTDALQVANSNDAAMKQELDRARALLEAAQQDGTASHLEVSAVMGAYDRGWDLGNIDVREDSLAERVLSALIVERGRAADLERKLDAHHRHDADTDADTVRARAAERILAYAAEEKPKVNDTYGQVYLSGLETAAALIVDESTESEPSADVESPFLPANQARAEAHLIKVALNHIADGHDPRGVLHFNDRPLAARVVGTIMNARTEAIAEFVKHQVTHYRDHSSNALDEDRTLAVRMGVAPAALLDEGELSPTESDAAAVIIKAGGKFTPSVEGAVAQAMTIDDRPIGPQIKYPDQLGEDTDE